MKLRIYRVGGKKQLNGRISKIKSSTSKRIPESLKYGGELLRDRAIDNLKATSMLHGLSAEGGSITDPSNWTIRKHGELGASIRCNSDHAAVVEFGGEKTGIVMIERGPNQPPFPIGLQQRQEPVFKRKFAIQPPKAYLRSAIDSEWVRQSIRNRIRRDLLKVIRGP